MDSYSKLQESLLCPNLTTTELNHLLAQVGSEQEGEAIEKIIESYQKMVLSCVKIAIKNSSPREVISGFVLADVGKELLPKKRRYENVLRQM